MIALFTVGCSYKPHAVIVTNLGEIEIELDGDAAPKHVDNFIKLVEERFYVGTTFHRVVPGFVVQGGDPNSKDENRMNDGTGDPGYQIDAEIGLPHKRGSVAAARKGDSVNPQKKSSGSQFYICLRDLPQLDRGGYTVFGQVIRGMEVIDKIAKLRRDPRDNPIQPVVMQQVYEN
jgi:cyclophilin family peptidyl-prolyl cis-trans isomerase